MKLKSFLAIVSCSAIGGSLAIGIALSTSTPSIAETVKEGYIQSQSTGIGNKDYRNKQSTPSMVGSWKSSVEDNEYRYTDPKEIYFDMASNGSTTFAFRKKGQPDSFGSEDYRLAPTKDPSVSVLKSINSDGETTSVSGIKWISNNEFIIRILKDPEAPHREGVQRRFVRIQEPVATQLQQKAQAAASRQKLDQLRKLEESRGRFNAGPHNTRTLINIYK